MTRKSDKGTGGPEDLLNLTLDEIRLTIASVLDQIHGRLKGSEALTDAEVLNTLLEIRDVSLLNWQVSTRGGTPKGTMSWSESFHKARKFVNEIGEDTRKTEQVFCAADKTAVEDALNVLFLPSAKRKSS